MNADILCEELLRQARDQRLTIGTAALLHQAARVVAAQAAAARKLSTALKQIADMPIDARTIRDHTMRDIARTALEAS